MISNTNRKMIQLLLVVDDDHGLNMYFTTSSLIFLSLPFVQWFASFWTLGANRGAYQHEAALELADKYNVSPEGVCVLQ